jgi:hypothetical protein
MQTAKAALRKRLINMDVLPSDFRYRVSTER